MKITVDGKEVEGVEKISPDYLTHPQGGWPVERFTVLTVSDPDAAFFDTDTIERWIREGMKREFMDDFADVIVAEDESFEGGYVVAPWPGHSHPEGGCDCGPELPQDWELQIKPLVMASTLCHNCGGVSPECMCTDVDD